MLRVYYVKSDWRGEIASVDYRCTDVQMTDQWVAVCFGLDGGQMSGPFRAIIVTVVAPHLRLNSWAA